LGPGIDIHPNTPQRQSAARAFQTFVATFAADFVENTNPAKVAAKVATKVLFTWLSG
jgi:hypothetical protein